MGIIKFYTVHGLNDRNEPHLLRHRVRAFEVGQALDDEDKECHWRFSIKHGRTLHVFARTYNGRKLKILLDPINPKDGEWRVKTAMEADKNEKKRHYKNN